MSILDKSVRPALTSYQKQVKVKANIVAKSKSLYDLAIEAFEQGMTSIWANADGLTPAEALAALGTDGAEIVNGAEALKDFINTIKPGTITAPTPAELQVDLDGRVTIVQ